MRQKDFCNTIRQKRSFKSDSIRGLLSRPKAHLHKLQFYEKLPTVRQIVLAYADRKRVEHHRRTEKGWEGEVLSTSESTLVLDAVEFPHRSGAHLLRRPFLKTLPDHL
jgi:hypothetical protein